VSRQAPFLVRLAYAVALDAARVTVALAQWFILDPSLCRTVGHHDQVIATPEVVRVCVRCGRTEPA
jgi:hypothetical protein